MILENLPLIGLLLVAAVFGGFIRRLSGFGGALIMTPLLMWVFPIPFLIPIVMCSEVFGGVLLSRQWKVHQTDRPRLWLMLVFSAASLPIGIWLGRFIPLVTLKTATSLVVLFFAAYLLFKPHVRVTSSNALDGLAGGLSGLLLGACGIGGPPAALYLNSTNQAFDRTRSLLSHFVSGISIFAIVAASFMGGGLGWITYLVFAIPAYWLGLRLAQWVLGVHAVSDNALKRLCLWLLIANAGFNLLFLLIFK
ncbi:sulfite exporter TauE/SafE family protein [Polynucleobacter paneuropaeus]|nr:sulfite exporter TauE/SafE family protein [Polynucleobacter paneuropaeus]MBT8575860.1 sulfite exporter TauE/SafE family protein [Polynucleobacter paneuropaeus]MBT8630476.1 sulfite exporter TauE/SafE family protein [Polynucleobacter paneuropaeus]MBT8633515.1 sulfite exporter TauE/SafE family protein [Polynucleobacter paneuropaeus]QWD00991.1 sulfite exporter TauE/SafE family protein [Polynucleobacter paneuropaeus]